MWFNNDTSSSTFSKDRLRVIERVHGSCHDDRIPLVWDAFLILESRRFEMGQDAIEDCFGSYIG
jgi:hypothetical protein